jgi:ABC-type Zn uptake system ZnuABC Zn-binding protein ZnuA
LLVARKEDRDGDQLRHPERLSQAPKSGPLSVERENVLAGREWDQHAWLDPRNGVIYVRNIAAALARLDPAGAADYGAHAAAYTAQIQAVDDWARKEMAAVPAGKRRVLIPCSGAARSTGLN